MDEEFLDGVLLAAFMGIAGIALGVWDCELERIVQYDSLID